MSGSWSKKSPVGTYIVIREGLPMNAFSGIDLMLLLWNPLEREKNNYRKSRVCLGVYVYMCVCGGGGTGVT